MCAPRVRPSPQQADQCALVDPRINSDSSWRHTGGGEFAKFIGDEIEKWAKVIKFAGIKPE